MSDLRIKLLTKNAYLQLPPDFRISMEWTNPLFSNDGSFSYPLNIPFNDYNSAILDFIDEVKSITSTNQYDVLVENGSNQIVCILKLDRIKDGFEGYLLANESLLNKALKNKLSVLDYGGLIEVDEAYQYYYYQFLQGIVAATGSVSINIKGLWTLNENFFGDRFSFTQYLANQINAHTAVHGCIAKCYGDYLMIRETVKGPSWLSSALIITDSSSGSVAINLVDTHDPLTDDELYYIGKHAWNTRQLIYKEKYNDRIFAQFVNPGFYQGKVDSPIANWFNQGITNTGYTNGNLIPQSYLKSLLKKIADYIGYSFEDDLFDDELEKIWVAGGTSLLKRVVPFSSGGTTINYTALSTYDMAKTLGNTTLMEVLQAAQTLFCAPLTIDNLNRKIKIQPFKLLLKQKPVDWSNKISIKELEQNFNDVITGYTVAFRNKGDVDFDSAISEPNQDNLKAPVKNIYVLPTKNNAAGDVRFVEALNQYYVVKLDDAQVEDTWEYFADNLSAYTFGNDTTEIAIEATPLLNTFWDFLGITIHDHVHDLYAQAPPNTILHSLLKIPYLNSPGNASGICSTEAESGVNVAFWRGDQLTGRDVIHNPAAQPIMDQCMNDNVNAMGKKIGNYSLSLNGENGLVETWYKEFMQFFMNAKSVSIYVDVQFYSLANLDWNQPFYAHGFMFIIKKIYVELPIIDKIKMDVVVKKMSNSPWYLNVRMLTKLQSDFTYYASTGKLIWTNISHAKSVIASTTATQSFFSGVPSIDANANGTPSGATILITDLKITTSDGLISKQDYLQIHMAAGVINLLINLKVDVTAVPASGETLKVHFKDVSEIIATVPGIVGNYNPAPLSWLWIDKGVPLVGGNGKSEFDFYFAPGKYNIRMIKNFPVNTNYAASQQVYSYDFVIEVY